MRITVIKRNGTETAFDANRISNAIIKAFEATGEIEKDKIKSTAESLTEQTIRTIRLRNTDRIDVESIQDIVEQALVQANLPATAKAYILYRNQRSENRDITNLVEETIGMFDNYLDDKDWQIKENANTQKSINGLNNYVRETFTKKYWLYKVYPEYIRKAHISGDLHLHDLGFFGPYCAGWDLKQLLMEGFGGVPQKMESAPAKHLRSFLGQIWNSTFTTQGESAGAQAWSSFDTYCAPFIRYDRLDYVQVKQCLQEFVFNMNVPTRVGFQCPFSNITLDIVCPKTLKNECVIVGGKPTDDTYGDFQKEMDIFNMALFDVLMEGDSKGRVFTFPIPTINITKEFCWDSPVADKIMQATCKYGIPYFSNYINSDLSPEDAMSMCPMTEDTRILIRIGTEFRIVSVKQLYDEGLGFEVWTKDGWKKAAANRWPKTRVLRIETETCAVRFGENHLQPIKGGKTLKAKDLKVGMYLPFNNNGFAAINYLERKRSKASSETLKSPDPSKRYDYFRITSIEEADYEGDFLYCVEVDSEDHTFMLANGLITHNCRLRLDKRELRKRGGGLFGSNPMTGSIGVVTLNMPRIGHLAKDESDLFDRIERLANIAKDSLEIKRKIIERETENGLYPYSAHYLRNVKDRTGQYWYNHFNTIGLVGMNECCLNFLKKDIGTKEGQELAIRVMHFLRDLMRKFQEETGHSYNLEATPAEGTSYRLAKIDQQMFGLDGIAFSGSTEPQYTNSTQLPVTYTDDIFECMDLQDELQSLYTGGTVQHLYLGERIEDIQTAKSLIKSIFGQYKMPYISITPTFSICPEHGYISGEEFICSRCGKNTEVWSRVVGYLRPVQNYNPGKLDEYLLRKKFILRNKIGVSQQSY